MAPATSFAALALLLGGAAAYPNGAPLGALPPRGWATWCTDDFCGLLDFCNEVEIQQVADALGACARARVCVCLCVCGGRRRRRPARGARALGVRVGS